MPKAPPRNRALTHPIECGRRTIAAEVGDSGSQCAWCLGRGGGRLRLGAAPQRKGLENPGREQQVAYLAYRAEAARRRRHQIGARARRSSMRSCSTSAVLQAEMSCPRAIEPRESLGARVVPRGRGLAEAAALAAARLANLERWRATGRAGPRGAHVCRGDYPAWLFSQLGLALHFYHPLVHWLVCGCGSSRNWPPTNGALVSQAAAPPTSGHWPNWRRGAMHNRSCGPLGPFFPVGTLS